MYTPLNTIGKRSLLPNIPNQFEAGEIEVLATSMVPYLSPQDAMGIAQLSENYSSEERQRKIIAAFLLLSLGDQIALLGSMGQSHPQTAQKLKKTITKPRISAQQYDEQVTALAGAVANAQAQSQSQSQNSSQPSANPGKGTDESIKQGLQKNGYEEFMGKQKANQIAKLKNSQKTKVSWSSKASSSIGWWVAGGIGGVFGAGALLS
ncbi:MAG: hypothetical protein WCJ84_00825 [Candidatus Peregrinibacteria bacterium]